MSLSPQQAQRGEKVTVTLIPDEEYELDTLTVLDGKGNTVAVTEAGEGKYTFTMPGSKVEVKVLFKERPAGVTPPAGGLPVPRRTGVPECDRRAVVHRRGGLGGLPGAGQRL